MRMDNGKPDLPPGFEKRHSLDAPVRLTLTVFGVVLVVVLVYLIAPAMRP